MVPNQEHMIHYACIARSTTTLAHRRHHVADPKIESLASQCIALAPPNHSFFSHTINHRTFSFLFDSPFLFFAIFDHHLPKHTQLRFLHRLRSASRPFLQSAPDDDLAPFCFQSQFDSVFQGALDFESGSNDAASPQNPSPGDDSSAKGNTSSAMAPLLEKPAEGLLKKKKRAAEPNRGADAKEGSVAAENKVEVCAEDTNGVCGAKDFSVAVAVAGKALVNDRHQKAKHVWKKHVWVVLTLDLLVCLVLFVIWLWVCRGFKCMAY